MQNIHSIVGGGAGVGSGGIRLFGDGDRRSLLRPQNQIHEMKCPRCDSLNTKFCYYNNYNLSQPRHFCKSCRRYWTKGGVLRNVPVGGGFRKNKRSKVKTSPESAKECKSSSNSSSESSNLTGTTPVITTATVTNTSPETEITPDLGEMRCLKSDISMFSLPASRFFVPLQNTSAYLDRILPELETSPELGTFMNMMTSSSIHDSAALNYKASDAMTSIPYRSNQQELQQIEKLTNFSDELRTEFLNQTVQFDLPIIQNRSNGGEFRTFDWQASGDFESTGIVDTADQVFWNHNQWSDHDNSLYLS